MAALDDRPRVRAAQVSASAGRAGNSARGTSTRNRAEQLRRCLQVINEVRSTLAWELVAVDNGSADHTASVIGEFAAASRVPILTVHEPRPGLGRARNAGWRRASGDIIAFTDDDCYVAGHYIDSVSAVFSQNSRLGYVAGRVLLHDPTDWPITIVESVETRHYPPRSLPIFGAIHGANMSFRREVLHSIGGFDDHLGAGTRFITEDYDALARASLAGWDGAYDPRPTVRHHHGRKATDLPDLERTYAIGRGAYWVKLVLRSDSRWMALRQWRWWIRGQSRHPHSRVRQEFLGAFLYGSSVIRVGGFEGS